MADTLPEVTITGNANTFSTGAAAVDVANNILSQGIAWLRDRSSRRWQEEMWNKQNEYNLPINQRKRLEEAGINPNLAFGSSASAMGTSLPSSPTTHVPQVSLGEFYLKKKAAEAQIRAQNAASQKQIADAENQRMQNDIMSNLFDYIMEGKRGDYQVQKIINDWKLDNATRELDINFLSAQAKKDLLVLQQELIKMETTKTEQAALNLKQEYDHLVKKYLFEDYYYDQRQNPYETSTILGMLRSLWGPISQWLNYFGIE